MTVKRNNEKPKFKRNTITYLCNCWMFRFSFTLVRAENRQNSFGTHNWLPFQRARCSPFVEHFSEANKKKIKFSQQLQRMQHIGSYWIIEKFNSFAMIYSNNVKSLGIRLRQYSKRIHILILSIQIQIQIHRSIVIDAKNITDFLFICKLSATISRFVSHARSSWIQRRLYVFAFMYFPKDQYHTALEFGT